MNPFEPLAYKIAEANREREQIRGHAESNGVAVDVDADGRTVGLRLDPDAGYLSLDQLATLIVELCRDAQADAATAVEVVMRPVREDPMAARVATFTEAAVNLNPARPQRAMTEDEMAAANAARISRQLRDRLPGRPAGGDAPSLEPKHPSHR